jgi:hypothetical protein
MNPNEAVLSVVVAGGLAVILGRPGAVVAHV